MKKRVYRYILKTYFRKKRDALFGILGVAICVAGFIGGGLLISNFLQLNIAQKKDLYGTQHAILLNASEEAISSLQASPDIQTAGVASVYAVSDIPNSVLQNKIFFGYLDRNAAGQASLRTIAGRMPESVDEIALEKATITRLGITDPVGSRITLDAEELNPLSAQAEGSYTFTIVGVVKNYSELQGNVSSEGVSAEFALPNAFVTPEHPICKNGIAVKQLYLTAAPEVAIDQLLHDDAQNLLLNEALYAGNPLFVLLSTDGTVNLIFFALLVFLLLSCLLGLYTSVKAAGSSRKETISQLKCIGADNRYFLLHYFLQDSLCLLIALPAGMLAGLLASRLLFGRIAAALQFEQPFQTHWAVILAALAAAALLFYLWSLAAVRQEMQKLPLEDAGKQRQQTGSKLPIFAKCPLLSWGLKSALYHSADTANMILAFSLCFIALLSGVTLTRVLQDTMRMTAVDYSVSLVDGNYYTLAQIQANPFYGFDSRDLQRFENNPEARSTWKFSSFPVKLLLENNVPSNPMYKEMRTASLQEQGSFEPENLRRELAAYQYTMQGLLYPEYINGLDSVSIQALQPYLEAGEINLEALQAGEQILLLSNGSDPQPFRVGEQLHFTQVIRKHPGDAADLSAERIDFSVEIGAILTLKDGRDALSEIWGQNGLNFLWHEDAFAAHQLPVKTNYLYIELEDPELYERTEFLLEELSALYPNCTIYSQPQNSEANQRQMTGITWVCALAVVFITLLGLIQMVNMAFFKVSRQTKIWGALRAAGIEKGEAIRFQIFELMAILLIAWVIGMILSLVICYGLYFDTGVSVAQFFPWGLSAAALALLWICCIPIGVLSISSVYKQNIVELITHFD